MGLLVLNFKFLPDRCHWGRNSEHLPPEKEGVAEARPPLFKAAFLSREALVWQGDWLTTVCETPMLLHFLVGGYFASIHFHITDEDQRG